MYYLVSEQDSLSACLQLSSSQAISAENWVASRSWTSCNIILSKCTAFCLSAVRRWMMTLALSEECRTRCILEAKSESYIHSIRYASRRQGTYMTRQPDTLAYEKKTQQIADGLNTRGGTYGSCNEHHNIGDRST